MLKFSLSHSASFIPISINTVHKQQSLLNNHVTSEKSFTVNDSKTNLETTTNNKSSLTSPIIQAPMSPFNTGTMDIDTSGASISFSTEVLETEKLIVIVRHGLTDWNEQKRIQGSSEEATLSLYGIEQAIKCRDAISRIPFDNCFSSPIPRAYKTACIIWDGRDGPLYKLDELKEANLGFLQGLKNKDAAERHATLYRCWREKPEEFKIDGRQPVIEVFEEAKKAWKKIMNASGSTHLIVTHKSILRALLCTALNLPPSSFRSVDVNNGSVSMFRVNRKGEPMLSGLNLTSHIHAKNVYY